MHDVDLINLHTTLKSFGDNAAKYPGAWIETTGMDEKQVQALNNLADQLYLPHTRFKAPLHSLLGSVVLFNGDITVKFVVDEFAEFMANLDSFYKNIPKANPQPKLAEFYKQIGPNPRSTFELLFKDTMVTVLQKYNCTITIEQVMAEYKSRRQAHIELFGAIK
jgi:hypothetical protein